MTSIRFDHVWKLFDERTAAVSDLNLEIRSGEFLVLVGPSGCGKTTSLRMLAGLERPSHGRLWMDTHDVTDLAPGQRDVAMVFQSYALYPNMTVYKNLAFGPKVRREPSSETRRRIEDVADTLGIRELLGRHPGALSGGQRQRVALGRALIREPRIFLMDEPLSNLDAALRVQMRAELIRLHKRLELTTTVYVTHDQVEALTMGDRVAVLKDGVLLQVDTPTELYEDPANTFVAEFIGSPKMNLFLGTITGQTNNWQLSCLGLTLTLPVELTSRLTLQGSGELLVGVRPHDLTPPVSEHHASLATIEATIDVCEHTGTEIFATVVRDDARIIARLPRSPTPQQADRIQLCFDPARLYLFDASTGASVLSDHPSDSKNGAPDDSRGRNMSQYA